MKPNEATMESVIAPEVAQIALTENLALKIKNDPIVITTRKSPVTPIQGRIGARNQNRGIPLKQLEEEETTVAIALEAVTEDRTMIVLPQIIWH
tara:strand:+ start:196 stop:477 length:282 start_codon:yes stop_codon:yes gene_type:complete